MTITKLMETITGNFGQKLTEAKVVDGVTYLSTPDGFLYAILEDPKTLTAASLGKIVSNGLRAYQHVVVLSPGTMPDGVVEAAGSKGVTVVQGERFDYLLRVLDLAPVPEAKTPGKPVSSTLPTADRLDRLMKLGEEWSTFDMPALAARFYGEAVRLKPEFYPAILGLGESYLKLSLPDMAQATFDRVLELQQGNFAARLGIARAHGLRGRVKKEIDHLEVLLRETPGNIVVRAHLLAALVEAKRWEDALIHVEELLRVAPREGRFHAMKAALLHHTGQALLAKKEERLTLSLGVTGEDLSLVYSTMHLTVEHSPPPRKAKGKR